MKWLFGIFFIAMASLAFGVRVHPENAGRFFEKENFENYVELEFASGRRVAGKQVRDSLTSVEMAMGNGTAVFQKQEIHRMTPLDPAAVQAGNYADLILESGNARPLISVRYEDSVFYGIEKRLDRWMRRIAQTLRTHAPSWNLFNPKTVNTSVQEGGALPDLPAAGAGLFAALSREGSGGENYDALLKNSLEKFKNSKQNLL